VSRSLVVALVAAAALVAIPNAFAGGVRVHVTGGGTITLWPSGAQPCRADTPMLSGGCIYDDGGGGLILQEAADPGWAFTFWPYPQCFSYPGGYCQLSGPQGASCCSDLYVTFTKLSYPLAVAMSGTGHGAVVSSPPGIDCGATCSANYDWSTQVTLTPQPAVGSSFSEWTGACSGRGPCTVTMTAAAAVTAVFDLASFPLAVTVQGTGRGTVTSQPAGIACGARCTSSFLFGTAVTLGAIAATGSHFVGWSGACSGAGTCTTTIAATPTPIGARFDAVGVTTRLLGRTLSLALWVERSSRLTVSLVGSSTYSRTLSLPQGRARPSLTLPRRLRAGRYLVRFALRDALGTAQLAPTRVYLR